MHAGADVTHLLRDLTPQILGVLVRRHGDFAAAEDAVQEALIAASSQWPADGVPENPRGWLYQVASRRLSDHWRSEAARRRREEAAATQEAIDAPFAPAPDEPAVQDDDSPGLLFMCCHPSLTPPSAIALTLRAVGGLTTAEIARAFLVPESTMAQRISRAKQSIRASGVPFAPPSGAERTLRVAAVLQVLYLTFNEGYTSTAGDVLQRTDLSSEAIRLGRGLHAALPDDAEVSGLLALMLLTDARREARTDAQGSLIPLDEQDRSRWNRGLIDEGVALVSAALSRGRVGPYQVQAAIAALHDEAHDFAATDWAQILALYELLCRLSDNPVVVLNQAVAVAMVHGAAAGLEHLRPLDGDPRISSHYRLDAVRGHLCEMLGDLQAAMRHYRAAAERTTSRPERDYLLVKAARLNLDGGAEALERSATDPHLSTPARA
ncbi:MAG: sigma-70 family RNA polymerase sigma factor [Gemmatimonadaceae bacterium]|nr:sigma-70 family RNA polymerase sigma factor [Gemmatimonadaceae bacterium]